MSRIGQCPACRSVYELEDDSIGQVFQCECDVTLFAADITGFSELPVFCSQCDGHYVVDSDGAGEEVECECGATIVVPNIVLRQPVNGRDKDAQRSLGSQAKPSLEPGQRLVSCPDCDSQYTITNADLGVEAECSCGTVFTAKINKAKEIVAIKVTAQKPVAPASRRSKSPGDNESDSEKSSPAQRERKRSPLVTAGITFAALLLLFSLTMFGLRQSGMLTKAKPPPKPRPPLPATLPAPISASPIDTVAPEEDRQASEFEMAAADPSVTQDSIDVIPRASAPATVGTSPIPARRNAAVADASSSPPSNQVATKPASFAPPPVKELPAAKPRRPLAPIVPAKTEGMTFDRVYKQAFDSFKATKELQPKKADDPEAFQKQVGQTIGLLQNALRLNRGNKDDANLHQIRYLLTYCYYHAGRLPEASVMAEAVVRWGKKKEPATKEAAMIGLAAAQEANQTHWGVPDQVGELDRMKSIINLYAKNWPNDANLDLMRMNLAQSYDRFNQPRKAAGAYRQIGEDSDHFVSSRLASGAGLWAEYRRLAAVETQPTGNQAKIQNMIRSAAKESFSSAVKKLVEVSDLPNKQALTAKLTLARIALSEGKLAEAEGWLTDEPMSLKDSISIEDHDDTVQFSSDFVRLVYETLFSVRSQQKNMPGATQALTELGGKLGDGADISKMYLSVATNYIDQLSQTDQITQQQFSNLVELIQPLQSDQGALTSSNILWLGESWSRLSQRAASDQLARQCNEKAAAAYELAMSRDDFASSSKLAALVRRSQLLRAAGQLDQAVQSLSDVLQETPNAFGLQIEAAEAIQQSAIESAQPLTLANAVDGPKNSPIWGWEKLVTTLYASSGDESKNAERLAKCQYQMVYCRWQIASATRDANQRAARMADLTKLINRLEATMKRDIQPWYGQFKQLAEDVKAESAK